MDLPSGIPVPRPRQDLDVVIDLPALGDRSLDFELWSDGSAEENAGGGVEIEVRGGVGFRVRLRKGRELLELGTAPLLEQIQLRDLPGRGARLAFARGDGSRWREEGTIAIEGPEPRGALLRSPPGANLSIAPLLPPQALLLRRSEGELADWKLYQRGPADTAPIPVPLSYRADGLACLQLQLRDGETAMPLPGFDFPSRSFRLAAAPAGAAAEALLAEVPTGGNYHLSARLTRPDGTLLGEDEVQHLAVGDVFLAAGQSNMAGYSGALEPAEEPTRLVHLFGNDYRWKQAREPMDDDTDQVDLVSKDRPQHSLMLPFAKAVAQAAAVPVAIIPAPAYATGLYGPWQRREEAPLGRGSLYGSAAHRVLAQRYAHPIRGLLWYQGEADAGNSVEVYRQELADLVAGLRADLRAPDLALGLCQLASQSLPDITSEDWLQIQEAQRRLAKDDARCSLVALTDLPRTDEVHLSLPAVKEAGRRLAQAVLRGAYGLPTQIGPQLTSLRFTEGGRGAVELLFDKDLEGGLAALFRVEDQSGVAPPAGLEIEGRRVVLRLRRPARGATRLSYGYGRSAGAGWLRGRDGSGATALFYEVPVE